MTDLLAEVFRALHHARADGSVTAVAVRMSEAQARGLWAQQHEAALNAGVSPDLLMPPLPAHLPVQDDGALPGYQVAGLPLYLHDQDEIQVGGSRGRSGPPERWVP